MMWIAAGGALGALARYGLTGWVQARAGFFPWGTLVVNVVGCLLLGFTFRCLESSALPATLRQGLTVGFLGAFTTFSTFSFEAVALARDGDLGHAATYVAASVFLGLGAVVAGIAGADLFLHARG